MEVTELPLKVSVLGSLSLRFIQFLNLTQKWLKLMIMLMAVAMAVAVAMAMIMVVLTPLFLDCFELTLPQHYRWTLTPKQMLILDSVVWCCHYKHTAYTWCTTEQKNIQYIK